jgi:presenilin-like A22 family membrane protease
MSFYQIINRTQTSEEGGELLPIFFMGCFFVIIYGLGLLFTSPFQLAGIEPAFENPENPLNIIYIFVIIMVFTAIILLIAKFWKKKVIQIIILLAIGYTSFYAFFLPLFILLIPKVPALVSLTCAISSTFVLILSLYKYPEWYVIDICGIIVGTSAIVIFGISLSILLILILLIGLACYDVISVYKTKHMIDLADTVMDLKLPVLLVVPKIRGYSLLKDQTRLKKQLEEKKERDAFFIGLGDVVMPGILVIASYSYSITMGWSGFLLVLSVIIGTLVGFLILMTFVIKGKPQAGLPSLCGGAIVGYLIASYILFGRFIGINLSF